MALSTTIQLLQERDRVRDEREAQLDRPRMVENWRSDIREVYDLIRAALKGYEDSGLARFDEEEIEVTEELLGTAAYPRLTIEIVGRRIIVTPIARFAVGSKGRLDMYRENRPTEDDRALIIRGLIVADHDPSHWWIETKGDALTRPPGPLNGYVRGSRRYRILEPSAIEAAIDYLLQIP